MTALPELIARVEAAGGADRELDALILCALFAPPGSKVEQSPLNGAWCIYEPREHRPQPYSLWDGLPRELRINRDLTSSLDAVTALIAERLPPGFLWALLAEVIIERMADSPQTQGKDELVRHLLAATLKAIASTGESA